MRSLTLVVLVIAGVGCAIRGWATQTIPSTRPMTEAEDLALKVADADLIVVGHVRSRYDTVTSIHVSTVDVMRQVGVVTFEPMRVLRGPSQPRSMTYLQWVHKTAWPDEEKVGDRTASFDLSGTEAAILFLDDLHMRNAEGLKRMPEDKISRWATREPFYANWTEQYERAVKEEIAEQRPESMAAHSDRIVIAHPSDELWMDPQPWIVERTIRGVSTDRVTVRVVSPASQGRGPNLLLLRKVGSLYEPVRLGAGIVPVRSGRVPRWNCSVEQAIARIAR